MFRQIIFLVMMALLAISAVSARMLVANVHSDFPASRFVLQNKAQKSDLVEFKILLVEQNKDILDELFWEVSNPQSASYGKYLSKKEIDSLTGATREAVQSVTKHLLASGLNKKEFSIHGDYIQVHTTVVKAEAVFEAEFYKFVSLVSGEERIRVYGDASLPTELAQHVDFVVGISEFIEDKKFTEAIKETLSALESKPSVAKNLKAPAGGPTMTPSVIKSYYGVPSNLKATNQESYQMIAAFNDFFSLGALQYFDSKFGISSSDVKVNRQGPNCMAQQCDEMESNLDIQYSTAMALGANTLFKNHANGQWVLDFALEIASASPLPMVASLSYGFSEIEQCLLTNECTTLNYDNLQYIERTNTAFQKLGLMGMTIFVSSGDDGATSFYYTSGNNPIDPSHYCPLGGCASTSTQCPMITISYAANGTECFFPGGVGSVACQSTLSNQDGANAINAFMRANAGGKCAASIEQDVEKNYHVHTSCSCSSLKTYSANGFKVSGYSYTEQNGALFYPDFPTSSPYVTSVGASQILDTSKPEVVCSIATGAIITGGGGFSNIQPQPSYQSSAVSSFLSAGVNLPPSYSFNTSGRAYPDISLVGHAYSIGVSASSSDKCPCSLQSVDGTSCSSPTLAGMVTLINDQLLNANKPQLGFLNPLLYQAAASQSNFFNDITTGNNNCNHAYCMLYGFSATKGYDTASGLGSINFAKFSSYVLSK
ncbi:hypothetical protein DFA_05962 [Cavenderia fasciculata]|uniref:Peptidase S53 domain-containing protein n=1 Tax=Cavenderia fasciculata TaxID=261658 RepID=F4PJQ2_CACFS|nr:uncharacterized protein DFA_05962 [Cavenderia fasciculata]EGG23826.1 hypothetical protein DFA_05962 [Cavenderia fasciculata]|eukprot:XP_004361677.1 hypothetical protein DFA_05962 [Cavenderia fasciculata]